MSYSRHYADAVRFAETAGRHLTEDPGDMRIAEVAAWTAQAHATLALHDLLRDAATSVASLVNSAGPALATLLADRAPAAPAAPSTVGPASIWRDRDGDLWVFDPATGRPWQLTVTGHYHPPSELRGREDVEDHFGPLVECPWPWAGRP